MTPLARFLSTVPKAHRENKDWQLDQKNQQLYYQGQLFDLAIFHDLLTPVVYYFREWQKMNNLEAQVLVVSAKDYTRYYQAFPILPLPKETAYRVVILPQLNTHVNSHIEDAYWYHTVKGNPILRIHSHHSFDAYQSHTDHDSLNSGTLEMVIGHIEQPMVSVAYWLTRYSDPTAKDRVFTEKLPIA